jgi:arginine transport system substrate-binding protein
MIKKIILGLTALGFFIISHGALANTVKTITWATEATYPPFEFIEASGQIKGYDIDIANALCAQIKAQCTFSNQPWDSLIPSLKLGKFDALIGAIAITDARKQQVDFTNPYYENAASFVAPIAQHLALTSASLKGKTIGVQGGTTFAQYVQAKYGDEVTVKGYPSLQEALLDLTAGRVDVVFGDQPVIQEWLKKNTRQYAQLGKPIYDEKYFGIGNGIAVRKGKNDLLNALNQALVTIKKNGTYDKINQHYFGKTP